MAINEQGERVDGNIIRAVEQAGEAAAQARDSMRELAYAHKLQTSRRDVKLDVVPPVIEYTRAPRGPLAQNDEAEVGEKVPLHTDLLQMLGQMVVVDDQRVAQKCRDAVKKILEDEKYGPTAEQRKRWPQHAVAHDARDRIAAIRDWLLKRDQQARAECASCNGTGWDAAGLTAREVQIRMATGAVFERRCPACNGLGHGTVDANERVTSDGIPIDVLEHVGVDIAAYERENAVMVAEIAPDVGAMIEADPNVRPPAEHAAGALRAISR